MRSRGARRRPAAWEWYLLGSIPLTALYFATPAEPAKLVLWPVIGWSSVAAILIGSRRHRPDAAGAWQLLAAGVALFVIGDNLYSVRHFVLDATNLFPSYVDVVYLTMYPVLVAGLLTLIRRRTPGRDRASLLDAGLLAAAAGLVWWVVLVTPHFRAENIGIVERLTSVAYPLADLALLAIVARLAVGPGRRPVAFWLLAGGVVSLLVADALYGYANLAGTFEEHSAIDLGWIVFYTAWGAAALHPSMRDLSRRTPIASTVTPRRLMVLGAAALVPSIVLLVEQVDGDVVDGFAIAAAGALVFTLALARTAGLAREIAELQQADRFRRLISDVSDAVFVLDDDGIVRFHTAAAATMFERGPAEIADRPLGDLLGDDDLAGLELLLGSAGGRATLDWSVRTRDGRTVDIEVIAVHKPHAGPGEDGTVLTMRDVTERNALMAELRDQALHDRLTGLPNRVLFADRVGHALIGLAPGRGELAVLLLDLDDFQVVNDSLGHAAGDELLTAVATRLTAGVTSSDTVARLGGDEFAILLAVEEDALHAAEVVAARVLDALAAPFRLVGQDVQVHASIGIAVARGGVETASQVLGNADLAMYLAKRKGKARWERFAPQLRRDAVQQLQVASELRGAIEDKQLELHYQPIVDLPTRRVQAVEALVRWQHPHRGLLGPSEFLPIAESSTLAVPLGRWVLDEACRQASRWLRAGLVDGDFYISVNLSAQHFRDVDVAGDVTHALEGAGLPARALLIEITETALVDDLDAERLHIRDLLARGTRLAIDDFGTGYSSLSRLTSMPFDVVKIDRSFVERLSTDPAAGVMVRAVVAMCEGLGLQAVAEGVEHHDQAVALAALGCTLAQGYLFARPLDVATMTTRLEADRRRVLAGA